MLTFDGPPMPAYPGLLTELILDLRNVIVAPQTAGWNLMQAVVNGDPTTIGQTLLTGLQNVGTADPQFPVSVAAGESFSDAFADRSSSG